jgi:formylglycine-generating enzyme required for sulfatase activity
MKNILILSLLCCYQFSFGNGINVSNVSFNAPTNEISFDLTWENSFSTSPANPQFFDGAWVFIKYAPNGGDVWHHAPIMDSTPITGVSLYISYDDLGIMVYDVSPHSGTFGPHTLTLELGTLLGAYQDFKVFALEMIYIAQGSFYAGDGSSGGRFYQGNVNDPWYITSENAITRGPGPTQFDQEGQVSAQDLSADFPKGYNAIWTMKYKITAEQYIDFLNCLTRQQQENRVQSDIRGATVTNRYVMTNTSTPVGRNPIVCDVNIGNGPVTFYADLDNTNPPNAVNDGANIALPHMSVKDILAYMDWSGLRPMTELEFEKLCRGTDMPVVPGEYGWGTATFNAAGAITNGGTTTESTSNVSILSSLFKSDPLRVGYAATATSSRTQAGGTFFGVMDIHNLGEFMMGVKSTAFVKSSYGDGTLDGNGEADVTDWVTGAELLGNGSASAPEAISKGKTVLPLTSRSAVMGARGVRRLLL